MEVKNKIGYFARAWLVYYVGRLVAGVVWKKYSINLCQFVEALNFLRKGMMIWAKRFYKLLLGALCC